MVDREARTLARDVEVAAIPYGDKLTLTAGTTVYVTQALGGLLHRHDGPRLHGADRGQGRATPSGKRWWRRPPRPTSRGRTSQDRAWDQLKTCFDPEIPVNIVDLGLVYKCEVAPVAEGEKVTVHFTLTAPGCGMGDYLKRDVEQKLLALPGVKEADVQVVLEPAWNQSMMSDAARLQLGLM